MLPVTYAQMDEFILESTGESLTPEEKLGLFVTALDAQILKFDHRYAPLLVSYDEDLSTEHIDNYRFAGDQLSLCLDMIQAMGVGMSILEGLHSQAIAMAMDVSTQKTMEGKKEDAKRLCVKVITRRNFFTLAIKNIEWRIPVLREASKVPIIPG